MPRPGRARVWSAAGIGEDAVHGTEVGRVDDAGLAVDAFGDRDVIVGVAALDFLDEGGHGGLTG